MHDKSEKLAKTLSNTRIDEYGHFIVNLGALASLYTNYVIGKKLEMVQILLTLHHEAMVDQRNMNGCKST